MRDREKERRLKCAGIFGFWNNLSNIWKHFQLGNVNAKKNRTVKSALNQFKE